MDFNIPVSSVLHCLRVCLNSCPLSQCCHLTISSSATLFSICLQYFPASEQFREHILVTGRSPKVWSFLASHHCARDFTKARGQGWDIGGQPSDGRCRPWVQAGLGTLTSRGECLKYTPISCQHSCCFAAQFVGNGQAGEEEESPWTLSPLPSTPREGHDLHRCFHFLQFKWVFGEGKKAQNQPPRFWQRVGLPQGTWALLASVFLL